MKDQAKHGENAPQEALERLADSAKETTARDEASCASGPAANSEMTESLAETKLDKSLDLSFPASDPIATPSLSGRRESAPCADVLEDLLDQAIEMTFPASDPVAVSVYSELVAASPSHRDSRLGAP